MIRSALAFSGGRDSLALLLHVQALWDMLDVIHIDTGDTYPVVRDLVAVVEREVPHFVRLKSDPRGWRAKHGDPTNENWVRCCAANLWQPMHEHLKHGGYRQVLRGDRADEGHVQPVMPGDVLDGVLYTFPLWTWSKAAVNRFLTMSGSLLPPYANGADGLPDCRSCTATAACGGTSKVIWEAAYGPAPVRSDA